MPGTVAGMKVDSVGGYAPGAGSTPFVAAGAPLGTSPVGMSSWPLVSDPASFFSAENAAGTNGEFSVLSQFLDNLDANPWFNNPSITNPSTSLLATSSTPGTQQPQVTGSSSAMSASPLQFTLTGGGASDSGLSQATSPLKSGSQHQISLPQALSPQTERLTASASQLLLDPQPQRKHSKPPPPQEQTHHEHEHVDPLPPSTKTERFLITAADQEDGTREERLKA
ncbi:hypothetical protein FRB90_007811, partial [Tulasnella sp. 427]